MLLARRLGTLDQLSDLVVADGRDPGGLPVVLRTAASLAPEGHGRGSALFAGDPAGWPDDLARLAGLGVDHVLLQFAPTDRVDEILTAMTHLCGGAAPRDAPRRSGPDQGADLSSDWLATAADST